MRKQNSGLFLLSIASLAIGCVGEIGNGQSDTEKAFFEGAGIPIRARLSLGEDTAPATGSFVMDMVKHGETYVAEGDILLPGERVSEDIELVDDEQLALPAALISATPTWNTGVVPYVVSTDLADPGRVTRAIAHWESLTPIKFVERTHQTDYLRFVPGNGCASYVGRIGGAQDVWLHPQCSDGNTVHEIGHALGAWHEQSRSDRDAHVTVLFENIQAGREFNFQTYDEQNQRGVDVGAYNFDSIMHYDSYAFSANGQPTIVRADNGQPFRANRSGLSAGDIDAMTRLYGGNYGRFQPDGKICGGAVSFSYELVAGASVAQHEQIARLYCAALDRLPDPEGFRSWVSFLKDGNSLETIAYYFIASVEFRNRYGGNLSDSDFVTLLYALVLDRQPDEGGFAAWTSWLGAGGTRAGALTGFSESQEFVARMSSVL